MEDNLIERFKKRQAQIADAEQTKEYDFLTERAERSLVMLYETINTYVEYRAANGFYYPL
jgi:hypothetical protein